MIFVDADIPMYLVGGEHPHKREVQRLLERLATEQRRLVTSSEVFQELIHRYASADRRDWIEIAFQALQMIVDEVFAVEKDDVLLAKDLVCALPSVGARDAVHAAVMRRRKITEILTFDSRFDELADLERLPAPSGGA